MLFLGQINLRKGIGPLLDAIRLLRGEPIEVSLVGPIQISIPSDLRDDPQVRWVGPVPHEHTARFYRDADVFLFPTFSDGFGLTQLEAQAWKLPIVATKFCGNVVEDGRNGWLLPEVSPCAIAATCGAVVRIRRVCRNCQPDLFLPSDFLWPASGNNGCMFWSRSSARITRYNTKSQLCANRSFSERDELSDRAKLVFITIFRSYGVSFSRELGLGL